MFGSFGDDEDQGSGRALTTAETFYGTSNPSDWSSYPGAGGGDSAYSPPPLVASDPAEGKATSIADWFGMGKQVVGTVVDIFGNPVQKRPLTPPVPSSGVPVWGWALIGVGAVAVLGFTLRSVRSSPRRRYAGRNRRR